jgi:hypothetical protein
VIGERAGDGLKVLRRGVPDRRTIIWTTPPEQTPTEMSRVSPVEGEAERLARGNVFALAVLLLPAGDERGSPAAARVSTRYALELPRMSISRISGLLLLETRLETTGGEWWRNRWPRLERKCSLSRGKTTTGERRRRPGLAL